MGLCSQVHCKELPAFRYTWPGKDEELACPGHVLQLKAVAHALGCHVQFHVLTIDQLLAVVKEREAEQGPAYGGAASGGRD